MATKELEERASKAVGFPIHENLIVAMLCATCGEDHLGDEQNLPVGAIAKVSEIELYPSPQDIAITLVIPVDPGIQYDFESATCIVNVFDEGDTHNRFAFRPATPEEQAKLHPSWLDN
jgi:hypothetical protein